MKEENFRSIITDTDDGVTITLSMKRDKRTSIFAALWTIIWCLSLPLVYMIVLDLGLSVETVFFAAFWTLVGGSIAFNTIKLQFGKEVLTVSSETIAIGLKIFGLYFKRTYRRHDIKDFKHHWDDPFNGSRSNKITYHYAPTGLIFTHKGKKIKCGYGVRYDEAQYLIGSVMKLSMNYQELDQLA